MDNKQYLPPESSSIRGRLADFRAWTAYRHWRKRLENLFNDHNHISILESGCGPGFLSKNLKKWFPKADITLTDYEPTLLERSREETNLLNIFQCDSEALPFDSDTFDLVISFHMIEHLVNPDNFISEAYRVLKPNSYFIYATPNPVGIPARLLNQKWTGIREDHISLNTPGEWLEMTEGNGFKLIKEGTTTLSGIGLMKLPPLNILNYGLLFIFGFFPWKSGEAYIGIYKKTESSLSDRQENLTHTLISDMTILDYSEIINNKSLLKDDFTVNKFYDLVVDCINNSSIDIPNVEDVRFYFDPKNICAYPIIQGIPLLSNKFKIEIQVL